MTMKVIHTRATSEPILLISACPCMNLFALITRSAVTVYRSTTLTIVAVCVLHVRDVQAEHALCNVSAAWSPSGRVLSLALPDGTLWLLDVEAGELIRHLVPRALLKRIAAMNTNIVVTTSSSAEVYRTLSSAQVERLGGAYSLSVKDGRAAQHPTRTHHERCSSSSSEEDEDKDASENEEEHDNEEETNTDANDMMPVPLSTSEAPVAAMSWTLLRTSTALSVTYQSVCLPLAVQRTTPLLEELLGPPPSSQSNTLNNSNGDTKKDAVGVATLWVLDVRGGLSVVLGGLQEVCFFTCHLPFSLQPSGNGKGGCVVRRMCVIEAKDTANCSSSTAQRIASYAFAHFTRRALSREPGVSHRLYLVCANQTQEQLYMLDLGHHLTPLLEPHVIANVCVAEYIRLAEACVTAVRRRWAHALQRHVRQPLQLPRAAALLRDAVVEQIAMPDMNEAEVDEETEAGERGKEHHELLAYYASLPLERLAKVPERLRRLLRRLARRVYLVSYRCYDTALSLVQQSGQRRHDWLTSGNEIRGHQSHSSTTVSSSTTCNGSATAQPSAHSSQDTEALLTACIAERRYACACQMQRMQVEAQHEGELVSWVLQRAALLRALYAVNKDPQDSPVAGGALQPEAMATMETAQHIPLATERQPTLLHTLQCIKEGKSTSFASDHAETSEAVLEELRRVLQEHTCHNITISVPPTLVDTRGSSKVTVHEQASAIEGDKCMIELHFSPSGGSLACRLESHADTSNTLYLTPLEDDDKSANHNKSVTRLVLPPLPSSDSEAHVWQVSAYGPLSASRHLLLYSNCTSNEASGDTVRLVLHDEEGNNDAADNNSGEEEGASSTEESSRAAQMVEVKGLALRGPHSTQLSISAAREFCVVAVHDKLIVIDLYEE